MKKVNSPSKGFDYNDAFVGRGFSLNAASMGFKQPAAQLCLWFLIRKKPPSHSTAATHIRDQAQELSFNLNALGEALFWL